MATPTYTAIASITLGSSASSVTFSSIPQDYRDLVLVFNIQMATPREIGLQFNSDTTGHYSYVMAIGTGGVESGSSTTRTYIRTNNATNEGVSPSMSICQIQDYSATDKHKTVLTRANDGASNVRMLAGRWPDTSAITTMTVMNSAGNNFSAGSTLELFGIAS